jgi:hypothetical protein
MKKLEKTVVDEGDAEDQLNQGVVSARTSRWVCCKKAEAGTDSGLGTIIQIGRTLSKIYGKEETRKG